MSITKRAAGALVISIAIALGTGGSAFAGGSSSSLNVVVVSSPFNDGKPHYDGMITFDVKTSASRPYVAVACSQGGSIVYSASAGFYAGASQSDQYMTLASKTWTGGAADCTASLWYWKGARQRTLATTSFQADA